MLEPYNGEINEFYTDVFVKNPIVEDGLYISYEIIILTNNISFTSNSSSVRRRYSEFVELYKLLTKEFPSGSLPSLPPKHPFKDHFLPSFVEKRRNGLQQFIEKLVSQKIYLSSKALHLFLQSSHSMSEIRDIIRSREDPDKAFNRCLLNSRPFIFDSASNISDESSGLPISSHVVADINVNSFAAPSSSDCSNTGTKSENNLLSEGKRVSFCDQVTVAQILLD